MRVAARDRRGATVYLYVAEWGPPGRAAARCLSKGSMIAFTWELRFREAGGENGTKQFHSAVGHIEFLGARAQAHGEPEEPVTACAADDIPF